MNKLAHILLGLLYRKPCSGYELQKLLNLIWQAHHSQIYPLLAKLEKNHFVYFEETKDKPAKKIYFLTSLGKEKVENWLNEPTPFTLTKDEWVAKVYVIGSIDIELGKKLFYEREKYLQEQIKICQQKLETIEQRKENIEYYQHDFGRYLVVVRRIGLLKEELNWCAWAKECYQEFLTLKKRKTK